MVWEHERLPHFFAFKREVYFQVCGDVEEFPVAALSACEMEEDAVPDFVCQDELPFLLCEFCVEVDVDEDIVTVSACGLQSVVAHGDQFHAHDDASDEWPSLEEFLPILCKQLQASLLAHLLVITGDSCVDFLFHPVFSL